MHLVLMEQWSDADNPNKCYHGLLNGTFATWPEADEARELRKPMHDGGIISIKEVVQQQRKATPKKRRRVSNLRRPKH